MQARPAPPGVAGARGLSAAGITGCGPGTLAAAIASSRSARTSRSRVPRTPPPPESRGGGTRLDARL